MRALVVAVLVAACGGDDRVAEPPPVLIGDCVVHRYVGSYVTRQTCAWEGYYWECILGEVSSLHECNRGGKVEGPQ